MLKHDVLETKFCAQTIFAIRHTGEICGSNGLPLTPKSIGILGKSQIFKNLRHENLTTYVDFIRGKHERLLIVSEYCEQNLKSKWNDSKLDVIRLAYQILRALKYLNDSGIVHRCLSPDNILFDNNENVKLFNYGLYHMTSGGRDVEFPIGNVKYMAPEDLLSVSDVRYNSGAKSDIWSLGVILAEVFFNKIIWDNLKLGQRLRKVLSLVYCEDVLYRFARETDSLSKYQEMDEEFKYFLQTCLQVEPKNRKTAAELLEYKIFADFKEIIPSDIQTLKLTEDVYDDHPLCSWDLNELYYLWQLAGGDVHAELKKHGLIKNKPPILTTPSLILLEGMSFGNSKDTASLLDLTVVPLSLETLTLRLKHIKFHAYHPLIESRPYIKPNDEKESSENLPLIIREKDTEYQFHRIVLFKRLLEAYPYTRNKIYQEASKDIPPLFRGQVWAALLNIKGDIEVQYTAIDKETSIPTDRQIEVDVPRCHQYNELLSSKTGHLKLKRILKAWVVSNKQYVYWQGLDSLCAPFLYLNFNNEALAYVCFSAFIPKYLHNFFLKDNSLVIKEYLAKFSHLIAYHDPVLAKHLHEINFVPELFAIPWFLTMFSHVFPLHKIFHLWDKLLLGDSSYPLFVGLSILQQLRDVLLASGFNECILLFSDLPDIDIERCVINSTKLHMDTPKSITFRKHQMNSSRTSDFTITDEMSREMQKEMNPRLSVSDFIEMMKNKDCRSSVLIIDTRTNTQFCEKSVPGSINIPFKSIDFNKAICEGITSGPELSVVMNNKGNIIVIIANTTSEANQVCCFLTYSEFPKVCQLNGDIDCLHYCGILAPAIT